MSGWHRENPELVGTSADPWTIHPSYTRALQETARRSGYCPKCLDPVCRGDCDDEEVQHG